MTHVLYALGGLVLGVVLNHLSTTRADARRNRLLARGTARLLYRDVFNATLLIFVGLQTRTWPVDEDQPAPIHVPSSRFNLENWQRLGATFTATVQDQEDWEAVCVAFESMENENRLMDEGDPRAFNEDRLTRVRDRDLMAALDVLNRLQMPVARRIWRDVGMRRLDGEFYIPRERFSADDQQT